MQYKSSHINQCHPNVGASCKAEKARNFHRWNECMHSDTMVLNSQPGLTFLYYDILFDLAPYIPLADT